LFDAATKVFFSFQSRFVFLIHSFKHQPHPTTFNCLSWIHQCKVLVTQHEQANTQQYPHSNKNSIAQKTQSFSFYIYISEIPWMNIKMLKQSSLKGNQFIFSKKTVLNLFVQSLLCIAE